jgi:hypothetical protein
MPIRIVVRDYLPPMTNHCLANKIVISFGEKEGEHKAKGPFAKQ